MNDAELLDIFRKSEAHRETLAAMPAGTVLYDKPGEAWFECPLVGTEQAHTAWVFSWVSGSHHIDHEANGGVPPCARCGRQLVFAGGTDPGHRRGEAL